MSWILMMNNLDKYKLFPNSFLGERLEKSIKKKKIKNQKRSQNDGEKSIKKKKLKLT